MRPRDPDERTEVRDGKEYLVTVLPDAPPPADRSKTSRYHYQDVEKGGEGYNDGPRSKRRRPKKNG